MITAAIAPTWMTAVNAVTRLSSMPSPSIFSAIVRWPVLETGRNSVIPSTIAENDGLGESSRASVC